MNELLKHCSIDFKNKSPRDVGKRLPRMKSEGEMAKRNGDDRTAFILLKRWLNTVEWIKTTKPYKSEPSYYNKTFSIDKEAEVRALFSDVERKMIAFLAPVKSEQEIEDVTMAENRAKKNTSSIKGVLNLPETPTDEPLAKESDDFTTSFQLFQFLKPQFRPLIIDIRPADDFRASRIKSERCINIPADAIKNGVLAHTYEEFFKDEDSRFLYECRSHKTTDIIILLDWRTTSSTLFPGNKMCVLRNLLQNWDPGVKSPKISILDGGYSDWLNRYPSLVTNPKIEMPDVQSNAMDEILEQVQYPEWLNSDDSTNPFNDLRLQPSKKDESKIKRNIDNRIPDDRIANRSKENKTSSRITNKSLTTRNDRNSSIKSSRNDIENVDEIKDPYKLLNEKMSEISKYKRGKVDNHDSDDMNVDEDELIFETTKPTNDSTILNSKTKPKIDRSSKPSSSTKYAAEDKQVLTLKIRLSDLLKNLEQFQSEILWIQTGFYEQDENDNRIPREKSIRDDLKKRLKSLNLIVAELIKEKEELKEALSKVSLKKFVLNSSEENKMCQLDLSIGGSEQRLRAISLQQKTLREKIHNKEKAKSNTLKVNENVITKEPLKSDGSSANTGLKRSHSSPNLAQLDNGKIPLVDRSSKPRFPAAQISNRATISTASKLTWKDREQRLEPIFRDTRPGITGLKNLGNSCYMNSIIQCLSNNIRLAKYFNEDAYLDDLNKSLNICKQGQVADEVAHVIKALWRGQYKSISPRDLKVVIGQYRLQFDCNEQQDSHEFLVFLLEWLHNDLKKAVDYYSSGVSIARKQWYKSLNNGESIISELFVGQLKSSIICTTCNNSSITYETFNSLTLSLPNTNRCTLDECVKRFVTGQKVSGWTCDNCKVPREATKKFDFIKLPPTVVIHLNRFAENEGWLQKSNTSVDFPLADLNLATYLVDDDDSEDQIQYDFHKMSLYAVSVHYGTMSGGHYTAYCRNVGQHKWYKYDDQLVSEVSPSEVKNQGTSAYLLFYTTIGSESYPYIQRSPLMKLGRL